MGDANGNGQSKALAPYEVFRTELQSREAEIATLLPSTVSRDAFVNVAIIATKQNPELLDCDRRSLHKAVTAAARDGLMPDGKEGVILPQKEKVMVNGKETWIRSARWQAMAYGLRKRFRELDSVIVDAQVVHANDHFRRLQGDEPRIEHEPPPLGQPRGAMVGVYAIFKKAGSGEILHREVMDAAEVETVKSISRSPNGLMWKTFPGEAWRKTVIRRGSKTVPCSDKMREVIEGDDDLYDVSDRPAVTSVNVPPPAPRRLQQAPPAAPVIQDAEEVDPQLVDPDGYMMHLEEEMIVANKDPELLAEVWSSYQEHTKARLNKDYQERAEVLFVKYNKEAAQAAQKAAGQEPKQAPKHPPKSANQKPRDTLDLTPGE